MIRVFEPRISVIDKLNVLKSLNKNLISGTSPEVEKFETLYAKKFNMKFAVAVSSGSAALDLALQNVNLKNGDEVWKIDLGESLVAAASYAKGIILIGSEDGTLFALGKK